MALTDNDAKLARRLLTAYYPRDTDEFRHDLINICYKDVQALVDEARRAVAEELAATGLQVAYHLREDIMAALSHSLGKTQVAVTEEVVDVIRKTLSILAARNATAQAKAEAAWHRAEAAERALAAVSLIEQETSSSSSEKIASAAKVARKHLNGEPHAESETRGSEQPRHPGPAPEGLH